MKSDYAFYRVGAWLHIVAAAAIIALYKYEHYLLSAAVGVAVAMAWWALLSVAHSAAKRRDAIIEEELKR